MSYFEKHVFFCVNQRDGDEPCCNAAGASQMRDYAKGKIKSLGLDGTGKIRVNSSGCLGRCMEAPVIVVYPEGTWYTYVDQEDIDEIIDSHLIGGRVVERLKI